MNINDACGLKLHYNSFRANESKEEVHIYGHSWFTLYNNLYTDVRELRLKKREEKDRSDHRSGRRREEDTNSETSQLRKKHKSQLPKDVVPPPLATDAVEHYTPLSQTPIAQSVAALATPVTPAVVSRVTTSEHVLQSASGLLLLAPNVDRKLDEQSETTPVSPDQNKAHTPVAAAPNIKSPALLMAKLSLLKEQNIARKRQLEKEKQELQAALCTTLEKQIQEEEEKLKKLDDRATKIKLQKEAVAKGEVIEISDTEPEAVTQTSPRR